MDVEKEREGKGWERRGEKQSVLAGISRVFLPMWFPHTDSSWIPPLLSVSIPGPILSPHSPGKTTQQLNDFMILIWDGGGVEDES